MPAYLLAIDQGTTNSRAIIFNQKGIPLSHYEVGLNQFFPQEGWVEQNAEEMFNNSVLCCKQALKKICLTANDIAAIGISNQRETTIIWNRQTGKPIYPAIVWQDRRTSDYCKIISEPMIKKTIQEKTGLLIDPYFSATKIKWILDYVPSAREQAERGELAFGTVDCYLLWKLTQGQVHATDATNASRTLLFNIHTQQWDQSLLSLFTIPQSLLPIVLDSSAYFGDAHESIFGRKIPITGIAGDQQAATVGQACFYPGMVKSTYGTGAFMLLNTGTQIIDSKNQLLSTVAYRLNNKVTYGLEGSIFCAGTTIKWLRDNLKVIQTAEETEALARSVSSTEGVYFIPAFTGLGAPYWNPLARATICGMTRNTQIAHIVRASLEAVAYQTMDLFNAMVTDSQIPLETLRVDGGMVANNWLLQFLADILRLEVQRPECIETSALGAAYLAGLQIGMYQSLEEISQLSQINKQFFPLMQSDRSQELYDGWKQVIATLS